jgi:type I restriction enzyme S subunit
MRYYAGDLINRENGTIFGSVNRADIANLEIEVPQLSKQIEIGCTLRALDDKIANNTKINHHLEQMAGAIFKSWFVDFEPWGGVMPEDWREGKAEEFFDIAIGKTPPRKEPQWFTTNPNDVVWVSISDMGSCGMFISNSSEYLTAESVERFNVRIVPSGAVLLSFKLTVGRVSITDGAMTTNEAIVHFIQPSKKTLEYLYCYLKAFDYQSLGNTSSIATAVNSKTIKAMPFTMPDDEVLLKFHATTAPLFEQVRVNLAINARLAAIRDTLLPRLMSGDITINKEVQVI